MGRGPWYTVEPMKEVPMEYLVRVLIFMCLVWAVSYALETSHAPMFVRVVVTALFAGLIGGMLFGEKTKRDKRLPKLRVEGRVDRSRTLTSLKTTTRSR